jgi:HSP20 family molecular chaperone IbpA
MTTAEKGLAPRAGLAEKAQARRALLPAVDIAEDENGISMVADMPGVASEDLAIHVDGRVLSLEGNIKMDLPEGYQSRFAEFGGARYERRFNLSRELDTSAVEAKLDAGVLKLRIPKRAELKPHRIEIKS